LKWKNASRIRQKSRKADPAESGRRPSAWHISTTSLFAEWNEPLELQFIGHEGIQVVRAFASENRDGLRRRRPSDEFSRFELDQKRKEYKHKKGSTCIDTKQNRIKFKRRHGHGQRYCADLIGHECRKSG